ncbi:hypothetical protein GCM10016455_18570 [Aliiroseovarius zhejiangensis]|uniref:Uncharacterized protein n=1 Tax=Aliiroseovarius zhejiangensis TaxID=1632025 RepID=A0ABQ3J156_9RHOB|nr:hypothetical protein GCM10016455_18570 [Aliiroseovarius zhejiangensis]
MVLIVTCIVIAVIIKTIWDLLFRKIEREKLLASYAESPLSHLFTMVWAVFFVMFFVGIFVPMFGNIQVTVSGWKVWQIGFFGNFGMWLITWFIDVDELDESR